MRGFTWSAIGSRQYRKSGFAPPRNWASTSIRLLPLSRCSPISGRCPVTGTEWEFEDGLAGAREHGVPELLLYRKAARITADLDDRTTEFICGQRQP